jgi:hypothetical protein
MLKTQPGLGTYFPPKIQCDGTWRYLVTVEDWHNAEHDAQEAHRLQAHAAALEARLAQADLDRSEHAAKAAKLEDQAVFDKRHRDALFALRCGLRDIVFHEYDEDPLAVMRQLKEMRDRHRQWQVEILGKLGIPAHPRPDTCQELILDAIGRL